MAEDLTTPRLVYRGAAHQKGTEPDTVETCRVEDKAALDKALKEGWRLHRDDDSPAKAKDAAMTKAAADTAAAKAKADAAVKERADAAAKAAKE